MTGSFLTDLITSVHHWMDKTFHISNNGAPGKLDSNPSLFYSLSSSGYARLVYIPDKLKRNSRLIWPTVLSSTSGTLGGGGDDLVIYTPGNCLKINPEHVGPLQYFKKSKYYVHHWLLIFLKSWF